MMPNTSLLTAHAVSKSFTDTTGTVQVLKNAHLTVASGQSVALVGASGSGKSTFLALLAGLDLPTDGEIVLLGQSLTGLDEEARTVLRRGGTNNQIKTGTGIGKGVGFVFQNFQLIPHLTALENVLLPLELTFPQQSYAQQRDVALYWLEAVGLAAQAQQRAAVLSGGEQQRVALARAFVAQPAIIFADEPTGSLDHATGKRIEALLFEQVKTHGTALVLVTHDTVLAARCNVVYRIEQGIVSVA